jgi:hypothetical protein
MPSLKLLLATEMYGRDFILPMLGGRGPSSLLKCKSILGCGQYAVLKCKRFANTSGTGPVKEQPYTENRHRLLAEPSSGGIGPVRPGL